MRTLLFLSQVYVPDPASVGQHMADAAEAMARRGWRVVVFTSRSGYDDPRQEYPTSETLRGVEIRRFRWCSGGKRSLAARVIGQLFFVAQSAFWGLFVSGLRGLVFTTIPQISALAVLPIHWLRGCPLFLWVMDLNPDQAVASGHFSSDSWMVRALDALNRIVLRRAATVVALDRFMAERLALKAPIRGRVRVLPPWPHEDSLAPVEKPDNPFVARHGLHDKFVFMYSGNHSLAHPIETFLDAARELRTEPTLMFVFVGGGLRKREVDRLVQNERLPNVLSLPYQPLDAIRFSLSAADVHLVSMGDAMVGCVHPCKIYGAMALGKPLLLLGPERCHAAEIISTYRIGKRVGHGDRSGMVLALRTLAATDSKELRAMGERSARAIRDEFSLLRLRQAFCDEVDMAFADSSRPA